VQEGAWAYACWRFWFPATLLLCHTSVKGCACPTLRQREDDALAGHDLHDLGAFVQVL
jgi:hypothetical protein